MSRRTKKIARYRECIKRLEEENKKLEIQEILLKVTSYGGDGKASRKAEGEKYI